MAKYWVTKYALTQGIFEVEAEQSKHFETLISVPKSISVYHKPYWHETFEEALNHAESLRKKKIVSIRKQLSKFQDSTFGPDGKLKKK